MLPMFSFTCIPWWFKLELKRDGESCTQNTDLVIPDVFSFPLCWTNADCGMVKSKLYTDKLSWAFPPVNCTGELVLEFVS